MLSRFPNVHFSPLFASELPMANPDPPKRTQPQGPLKGIRILDLSSFIAGSYAAMLLGDLGAQIIKVEAPPWGDLARTWGPFLNGEAWMFQGWNRNKRSIGLNLGKPEGIEILNRLVRESDILIENFRPGITEKLGIDYPRLRELNPRLIYCSSTAFGNRGTDRLRPGYDPVFQALGGVAQMNAYFCGSPALASVSVADYQAAMLVVTGATAALYHRERTGEGQLVETSLLQGVMSVQSHFFVEGIDHQPSGAFGIFPYELFQTGAGLLFIGGATDKFWTLLCEALGLRELTSDPRYGRNPDRVARREELKPLLEEKLASKSAAEWESILVEKGVPAGKVAPHAEFFHDQQTTAMEMNPVISHSKAGNLRVSGVPIHFEKTPGSIQCSAPCLAEHTDEILQEMGYDDSAIAHLASASVVQLPSA